MNHDEIQSDALAGRLRAEADELTLEFSESLHAKIMDEVKRQRRPVHPRPAAFPNLLAVAALASLVIVVGVWSWHMIPTAKPEIVSTNRPAVTHPDISMPTVEDALAPADRGLRQVQYAYLDKDARNLTDYVMDQFNVLPGNR